MNRQKLEIKITITNLTPIIETHFQHLNIKVKVKGDCPPAWLAHAIMALCESYKREMVKRKTLEGY